MTGLILRRVEPSGPNVIASASGRVSPVEQPRGEAYLRRIVTAGVIARASAARRRVKDGARQG